MPFRELRPLPPRAKAAYEVPPSPPIRVFKSNDIGTEALAQELAASSLGRTEVGGCFLAIETGGLGVAPGWLIGLVVGAIVFNVVMGWLQKDRFYRP